MRIKISKTSRQKIIKYAKHSMVEALIAMLVFWMVYEGRHIEFIRSSAGDSAFSRFDSLVFSGLKSNDPYDTKVIVLKVDARYLKKEGLWDENNESTYGYIFPRSKISSFIEKIDSYPEKKQPLALFIDFDLKYGTAAFDKNKSRTRISDDDIKLLETLAKRRPYTIVLPKSAHSNIVEAYAMTSKPDKIGRSILEQIEKGKIVFSNVGFLASNHIVYRYNPLDVYDGKEYYHTALVLWKLRVEGYLSNSELEKIYPKKIFGDKSKVTKYGAALVESNILYKDRYDISTEGEELTQWEGLRGYSISDLFDENHTIKMSPDTIVMIGMDDGENDMHTIPIGNKETPGIWLHAQSLKTVLFLNGKLKVINVYIGGMIIFIVFFLVTLGTRILMGKIYAPIRFFIELFLLVGILLLISSYILIEYKHWINWFIPILIYYVDDIFMYIRTRWIEHIDSKGGNHA